jgi:hypothetical protein
VATQKSAGVCRNPVQFEISRETSAESTETLQQFITAWFTRNAKLSKPGNMDFDLIACLQLKRVDDCGGKADRQAISPL